ncbi:hypothetical protein [Rhizobium sp. 768_B6_N1_8]|uniref:hypothetical protein n=1 Tax=unclassified Rhizobium TaxID=2613769 RepID=UPI003F29D2C8
MRPLHQQMLKMPSIDRSSKGDQFSAMSKIPPPKVPEKHPDRFLNCQDAMHVGFQDLVDSAVKAGWRPEEVLVSLIELADNQALMMEANAEVEAALKILKRKGMF